MPWIEITQEFRFRPSPRVNLKYRPGRYNMTRAAAEAAIAAGKGKPAENPRKAAAKSED